MRRALTLCVVGLLLGSACGREGPLDRSVAVKAVDFSYSAPTTVPSGVVGFTLTNGGQQPHQAQLMRLLPGATVTKLIEAAKSGDESALVPLAAPFGGPNGIDPGATQHVSVNLAPGTYAFVCLIPDAKGRPHLSLGMGRGFVAGDPSGVTELDSAGPTASATEFDFSLPRTFDQPITFTNDGDQPHELQVLGIADGKTAADVVASFKSQSGPAGPPPYTAIGGAAVILPGQQEVFDLRIPAGTYFAMCFVTDPKSHAPHFALGMMKQFSVN